MKSINDKIKLYANTYVKGECRSNEYEAKIKQEKRLNEKLDLTDTICNEIPFKFTKTQKQHVKELIQTFPNFKALHTKASNEEIILSLIFYVKGLETHKNLIQDYPEVIHQIIKPEKQKLYPKTFEIIMWKINLHYIQKTPILPKEPENIDHNILYKG